MPLVTSGLGPLTGLLQSAADAGLPLGVPPRLRADDHPDWRPITELTTAPHRPLGPLLDRPAPLRGTPPHVAAALWWKWYSYWATLPMAMGFALNRRVPLMSVEHAAVRALDDSPYLVVGLSDVRVAALAAETEDTGDAGDAGGASEAGDVTAGDDAELAAVLARTLRAHCSPMVETLHALTRTGRRPLWGSVAEALAHPLLTYRQLLPGDPVAEARTLLRASGLSDLVEISAEGLRRRSCCLWVTVPGATPCSTCCVTA